MALDPRTSIAQFPIRFTEVEAVGNLPDPNATAAGTIIWVRTPGSMYLNIVTDAAGNPHQWVNIGPSIVPPASDWLLMYLVDNRATGAAAPFTTPVPGRGPFPTIAAAVAQLTADRAGLGADYPAVIAIVEGGDYPAPVSLPHNVALVGLQQGSGPIASISGLVTVSPASAGAVTIAGLRLTGGLLFGGASALELQLSKCLVVNAAVAIDVTNTNAGSSLALIDTDVVSTGGQQSVRSVRSVFVRNVNATGRIDLSVAGAGVFLLGSALLLTGRLLLPAGTNSSLFASRIDASVGAGAEVVLMAGGTLRLEQCSLSCGGKIGVAGSAPSTVVFSDLQALNPGAILGANMTHTPIPGVRSNVVVSVGALPHAIVPTTDVLRVTGGAPGTVTLPAISDLQQGRVLMVRNDDPGAPASPLAPLTLTANAADTINGGALGGNIIVPNETAVLLVADRTANNWIVLGQAAGSVLPAGTLKYLVANQAPIATPGTYGSVEEAMNDAATDGTSNAPIYVTPGIYAENAITLAAGQGREIIGLSEDPQAVQINYAGAGAFLTVSAGVRVGLRNVSIEVSSNAHLLQVNNAGATLQIDRCRLVNSLAGNAGAIIDGLAISSLQVRRSTLSNAGVGAKSVITTPAGSSSLLQETQIAAASVNEISLQMQGTVNVNDCVVTGRTTLTSAVATLLDSTFSTTGSANPTILTNATVLTVQNCIALYTAGQLVVGNIGGASLLSTIGAGFSLFPSAATSVGPYDTIANGLTINSIGRGDGKAQQNFTTAGGVTEDILASTEYARAVPGVPAPTRPVLRLPFAANHADGHELVVKNASSVNSMDVIPQGGESIDGLLTITLGPLDCLSLRSQRSGTWDRTP